GIDMNWHGFEPRIGLAWKILGSDKTVFRAGYGIFHDSAWSMGAQGLWQNPPFYAESDRFTGAGCAFATSYCATALGQTPSGISLSEGFQAFSAPPDLSTFTGALPAQVVLTAGYAGARGHHLLIYGNDLNTGSPSACVAGGSYTIGCLPGGAP